MHLRFQAAQAAPDLTTGAALPGKVNYLIGNDPSRWHTNVPTYNGSTYHSLYSGVDLQYTGTDGLLKGTYTVAAGADPARIRWQYGGTNGLTLDSAGNLQISVQDAPALIEHAPIAWQVINGRQVPVAVSYQIASDHTISFKLGAYDATQPLVIDPTLSYSTYVGSDGNEDGAAIAVDATGSAYIVGTILYNGHYPSDV